MKRVYLKKGREESLKRFHPWVFSGAILKQTGGVKEGDIVEIYSFHDEFLGCGHYQSGTIAVRVLSFDNSALKTQFWQMRLERAYRVRKLAGIISEESCNTNSYRLVHGEGDLLPGLIVDYYNGVAVIQAHSVGMYLSLNMVTDALKLVYHDKLKAVYNKSLSTAPQKGELKVEDGYLYKNNDSSDIGVIKENGLRFFVDWEEGQKTGFFLDQRENRDLLRRFANGKKVLNLFCYTGGFSVYAMTGGAELTHSVDSSVKAVEMTEKNIELNRDLYSSGSEHASFCTDAIEYIKKAERGFYDIIVVDPPAFAKHRGALPNALRAYQRLNQYAIDAVKDGGIILTYSCSQIVDRVSFSEAVFSAAANSGRDVTIIGRLTQPADHPVNIYHPEGEYLKGLVLMVN